MLNIDIENFEEICEAGEIPRDRNMRLNVKSKRNVIEPLYLVTISCVADKE